MIKKLNLLAIAIIIIGIPSCVNNTFRANYKDANTFIHSTENLLIKPFLKAHLKNGDVCILTDSWKVDTLLNRVTGEGTKYDFNRAKLSEGKVDIPIDSVAIFETNTKLKQPESGRIASLVILAGVDVVFGIICLTNPKACFGSCPTFYINEKDDFHYADAEGFSEAIRPSTQYSDIDALNNDRLYSGSFSLTMKNEALETHCVREVKLLVYPRNAGERVYHTIENDFYLCENSYPLSNAVAGEGDITELLRKPDRQERFSLSDEKNLSSKEEIFLRFDHTQNSGDLGLILNFRQTLLTTYLIYSAFGYMGDEVGDIIAKMERDGQINDRVKNGIKKELGKIDVYVWSDKKNTWEFQNGFYEIGPISINKQMMPLRGVPSGDNVRIKLVVNKGYWRIDYAALTSLKCKVDPVEVPPQEVLNKGLPDNNALGNILDPDKYLISMPGDEFKFIFSLPDQDKDYELFLYSKGYYLEWMRENWIKDKNLLKLWEMVEFPRKYLKDEAKAYKTYETTMEEQFWGSKIDTKQFVYHEK
jgi:hypothetical protein